MTNTYFNFPDGNSLTENTSARATALNSLFTSISDGFDEIPDLTLVTENRINYASATNTGNAYTVTLPTTLTVYTEGLSLFFKCPATNTDSATINVNGLGVKGLVRNNGSNLVANDMLSGNIVDVTYDGTVFRVTSIINGDVTSASASAVSAAASAASATASASSAAASALAFAGFVKIYNAALAAGAEFTVNNISVFANTLFMASCAVGGANTYDGVCIFGTGTDGATIPMSADASAICLVSDSHNWASPTSNKLVVGRELSGNKLVFKNTTAFPLNVTVFRTG